MNLSAPSDPLVIEMHRASFRVGTTLILHELNLSVASGEFIGIIGPNGAGKSTLLGLAGALLKPANAAKTLRVPETLRVSLALFGQEVWTVSEKQRCKLRSRVGMILQHLDFNPSVPITASEVIGIGCSGRKGLWHQLKAGDYREIEAVARRLDIQKILNRPYRNLSGGERQKVQLARALVQQPSLLLLDEPTTGLDPQWQERWVTLIGEVYRDYGITILMTTHLTGLLPDCCRRVLLLQEGRIVFDGPIEQGFDSKRLGDLYGCRMETIHRSGRWYCHSTGESEQ